MRVHEACKKTGLSRKAVHFYIQEGLVCPAKNENGYYDLSEVDLKTLKIIQRLRRLGLPIEVIHEAFRYPISLNFFPCIAMFINKSRKSMKWRPSWK